MSSEKRLRFRLRRGDFEVELEGEFEYVREQFEQLQGNLKPSLQNSTPLLKAAHGDIPPEMKDSVTGVVEYTAEGKPHLIVPVDNLSAKEAISVVMYSIHPKPVGDGELSSLLSSSWKATNDSVVRARVSELRKEGKLIADRGSYVLSGAGVQWVEGQVLPRLQKTP